jgi:hypothetical protein
MHELVPPYRLAKYPDWGMTFGVLFGPIPFVAAFAEES